ncbi:HypC/HybG/HupF family hydrogenase formation chaperone [Rhodobacter ferrooxidans]|uniref:Hydrogenase assembly chaperone hypC/hupF n=1 Tax=Rhodobacter ferrooxidans TaxID=371731 RepID=C8S274_9RHOB|nr:HypC/HybG/HupF family hydrogenase formation chaperone [Rhodobacter sp. SW2]EEW24946.1 hydrogenase assembly chaperone hypC/hupF [Rhodobacter sp. SW2]
MCLGVPMQLLAVDGIAGQASDGVNMQLLDLSLTPDAQPGDWVLAFLGAAREVISAAEAAQITNALVGLQSLMQGGDLGDAFADLESRSPSLPPHLQAALDAGLSQG